uniref:Si:dkeyp-97b10.3 n=1 Tax=Amphilophus citrinellus TaxID=61819 RepID=A0A3Q0SC34_AMPCI
EDDDEDYEGTYECSVTGLVFEAAERVLVRYSVLSWSKFGAFLRDSWKFAGPIFNVDTVNKDASVLKSIQFPHSICLARKLVGHSHSMLIVLHIKDNRPVIEPTVDHSGSHVKWNVTSLSPVGPIIQTSQAVEHHGVVLVYKQLTTDINSYSFHVYLATNNSSPVVLFDIISYNVLLLQFTDCAAKLYLCVSVQELKFTLAVTKMKGYFEAFFEERPPFKLSLVETNTEETVWSATIREGTSLTLKALLVKSQVKARLYAPKIVCMCVMCLFPDGVKTGITQGQDMSDKQLLQVAKRLGREWKEVAIFLDLAATELDDIQAAEKEVNMQKLKMLLKWKSKRRPGEATAKHLLQSVAELDNLPNEVYQTLQGKTL